MIHNIKKYTFLFVLGLAVSMLISCNKGKDDKDEDEKISTEEAAVLQDLLGVWDATEVTQDGEEPLVGNYSALELNIEANLEDGSDKVYTVTGGDLAFPDVSGASWSFVEGSNFSVIQREDGTLMRINELDGTNLVLQQDVDTELQTGDRVLSTGRYIYTFSK